MMSDGLDGKVPPMSLSKAWWMVPALPMPMLA